MQGVIVTSGSSLLIFGAGSSVAGSPGVLSHVQGPVRKIGNTAFTFPVGKNGEYAPIGISAPAGATSAFTAEYFDANPNPTYNVSLRDGTLDHISTCEYWDLQRTTGASNVSVTLSWDIRSCGVTNLADLRVAHWDPNLGTPIWKDMGIGTITGNTTAGTIRSNMLVSSFSPFTLASSSSFNPLPIQLVSFKTRCDKSRTLIEWITASEKNNSYFTVEKSKNGLSWKSVADINSKTNPEGANLYTYSDAAASYGDLTYYRLRQTDFNNEYSYSNVEVVKNCSPDPTERVYPNPTPGALTLESNYFGQEISIHTMNGDLIYSGRIENSKTTIDLSDHPAGLYILRTEGSNYRNIIQVLK